MATLSRGLQSGTWINQPKISTKPSTCLRILQKSREQKWYQTPNSSHFLTKKGRSHEPLILKISCSSKAIPVRESRRVQVSFDESQVLKKKSEEVEPYLNGRCMYIVGMMGSGKTTVGKVLSEVLGYSFYDCDTLIEQAVGETTVAEIFKLHGENFFRDNETEVLHKLCSMNRLVISTGGGAVVRPINWRHMQKGITVFLDVPLEALARRITAVGTGSRPLLDHESGDPYTKTMKRLSTLYEERGEAYENADARVSLENIAVKLGLEDVYDITPTAIATEALIQIESFMKE